jgi:hypothetical protein
MGLDPEPWQSGGPILLADDNRDAADQIAAVIFGSDWRAPDTATEVG